MPVDHLTDPAPTQLATGVLAVLAGAQLEAAAAEHGLRPEELTEAIQVYQAAGYAALERRAEQQWYQVLVEFPAWEAAETIAATRLGPRLDDLHHEGAIGGWWFLRKHPCWRLRLRRPGPGSGADLGAVAAVTETLTELTSLGLIAGWRGSIYEPEHASFGGPAAMAAVHDLFCADSRGVLGYARISSPRIGRREMSIMLVHALLRSAGLDWFESGDVFHRVAELRPSPQNSARLEAVDALADKVRTLVHAAAEAADPMFGPSGPAAFAAPWRDAFLTAGQRLGAAAADGRLDRGLRAVLTHVVIFHWNRLGLSATTQGVLARAATAAFLPRG
jgi:thiopeptide-type bacteriocin biosynthesis protein